MNQGCHRISALISLQCNTQHNINFIVLSNLVLIYSWLTAVIIFIYMLISIFVYMYFELIITQLHSLTILNDEVVRLRFKPEM